MQSILNKIKIHFKDYWLFYLLSSIGLILGIFYFIYQYTHHQFTFLEKVEIFGRTISFFEIINHFWVGLVILALVISSFLYCKGRKTFQKEKELYKKKEAFEKIIENVPVSIITLDKNGRVVSVNPYFYILSEKPLTDKMVGKSLFDFSFIKHSEELSSKYRNLLEKGVAFRHYNCFYSTIPGKLPKYIDIYAVPLKDKDGKIEGALSIAQDQTETFYALDEVKTKIRQLSLINQISRAINSVLNLREVLWLILRNAVKLINAVSGAILLFENENELVIKEVYNMPQGWQNIRVKVGQGICGYAALIQKPYFSNDVSKDPYYIGEVEMKNIKSELAVPIMLEKKIIGVIKIDSDENDRFKEGDIELMTILANNAAIAISNSKLYEEITELNKTLEAKVEQRTEELRVANQQLKKMIELKSQFIADASHELRTPLTIIKGNIDIALWNKDTKIKELRETLKLINEETEHMSGILADLMILTHAEAGRLHLNKTNVDINNLLKTVVQSTLVLAKEKNIKISIQNSIQNRITAFVDEDKFLKLLLNLVSNAIKYGRKNGWVKLLTVKNSQEIGITVSDNGIGIPDDELPFIFERFYRVDKVRTREKIGGSGLGLAICKSIAEAHGGYIDVKSKFGVGSQFMIHLPNNKTDFGGGKFLEDSSQAI